MKKLVSKLYILILMAFTVFFMTVIWKVTFGHLVEEYHTRQRNLEIAEMQAREKQVKSEITFKEAILDGEQRVRHYLGYRVLEQRWLEGHFHHIDFDFKPDKQNYCISCHGDMPHDKVKELRAFGNMHASFIGCQTCHVQLDGPGTTAVFKWYDRTSGQITASPVREGVAPGAYDSKIIPLERVDGEFRRIDTRDRIDFAREYRENEPTLTDLQKSKAKTIIHKIVSKKPYICQDCHQKEAPVLPFADLGYSRSRMNVIISSEVVGMINKYTQFYMPRILSPGFGEVPSSEPPAATVN